MPTYPSTAVTLWRLCPWHRNPLHRSSDRIEGVVRIFAVLVALVAIPVACSIGTIRYTVAAEHLRAEDAAKTAVTATIVDKPTRPTAIDGAGADPTRSEAVVRWQQNGRSGTAEVSAESTSAVGDPVPVWLGPDGRPTTAPRTSRTAAAEGVSAAVALLALVWTTAAALVWITASLCGIRRNARWDREWSDLDRPSRDRSPGD
ncbi:MAG: hypothetical protein HOQ24_03200 [Mycobacteriaceae bacterium]|nr:hypothetical protein [Mycobacteriaceae bacterium]